LRQDAMKSGFIAQEATRWRRVARFARNDSDL
jgi:hypothetical protein